MGITIGEFIEIAKGIIEAIVEFLTKYFEEQNGEETPEA